MKSDNKKLVAGLVQNLPRITLAVGLQCLGAIALTFATAVFAVPKWFVAFGVVFYLGWSEWVLLKYIGKLSKAVTRAN